MWIYIPSPSSPSVPAQEPETSPSDWRFQALERSATWRGKHMRPRNWSGRWKHTPWLRRLCGQMPEPSTASRGVEEFIASLPLIHANHSPVPASGSESKTRATSGQISPGSSGKPRLSLVFLENVRNHLRLGFEGVCRDLQEMGYDTRAGLFSSEEMGAPHKRVRLFALAVAASAECKGIWTVPNGMPDRSPNRVAELADSTGPGLPGRIDSAGDGGEACGIAPTKRRGDELANGAGRRLGELREPSGSDTPFQTLIGQAESWRPDTTSHPTVQATGTAGPTCWCGLTGCVLRSHKRRLNPYFSAWLQGWPLNWDSAQNGLIDFDQWEKVSRRLLWRWLSSYWQTRMDSISDGAPLFDVDR